MRPVLAILSAAIALGSAPASATTVVDATNDFLASYTGPRLADLDVTSFSVSYDAGSAQFLLGATMAGTIVAGSPGIYVIGVNTGTGTIRPFASIGQRNVIFNQAIVINKDGTGRLGAATLDSADISIVGNSFTARIDAALLPSTGFAFDRYGFNLWPRVGFAGNSDISDFAPDNALLSAVPEPASWALMIGGIGVTGAGLRRRRQIATIA